jgi:CheY-like chemotaxis protein
MGSLSRRPRVLVIEDEPLVSMLLDAMLDELGFDIVGIAASLADAIASAREAAFDCAILDVNLRGQRTDAVASMLRERGIPFLLATGYDNCDLGGAFSGAPVLAKPFDRDALHAAILEVLPIPEDQGGNC